jgi:hypothetical protein
VLLVLPPVMYFLKQSSEKSPNLYGGLAYFVNYSFQWKEITRNYLFFVKNN